MTEKTDNAQGWNDGIRHYVENIDFGFLVPLVAKDIENVLPSFQCLIIGDCLSRPVDSFITLNGPNGALSSLSGVFIESLDRLAGGCRSPDVDSAKAAFAKTIGKPDVSTITATGNVGSNSPGVVKSAALPIIRAIYSLGEFENFALTVVYLRSDEKGVHGLAISTEADCSRAAAVLALAAQGAFPIINTTLSSGLLSDEAMRDYYKFKDVETKVADVTKEGPDSNIIH